MQAQVDAGRDPGGGEYVAVVDEQHVGVDPNLGEEPLEVLGRCPVRGRQPAVEVPGGGEHIAAGADGDEPGAGPDVREGGGQFGGEPALLVHRAQLVGGGHDHGVGGGQRLGAVGDEEVEVGVGGDRAGRPYRAGEHVVQVPALGVPRAPEDALRDAQFEGEQSVQGEDDDAVRAEGRAGGGHGPILANAGFRATRSGRPSHGSSVT